ncbi:RING-H2 finger protein ATL8 [Forsythia ovata]|uniref:RING-H2 finger protein ATL8 n=1 Tax=Forsythia ovata TaxID=205694 RepID=A0ABD1PKV7_9LAMI
MDMTLRSRFLGGTNPPMLPPPAPLPPLKIGRDLWMILFTLLVLGFVCTIVYLKLSARTTAVVPPSHPAAANNGLKKKVLKYLPKLTYATNNDNLSDCAICLAEFAVGDELRVLPQCCHGFHVECIDTWLGFHSSCPSCRRNVVVTSCQKCSGGCLPVTSYSSSSSAGAES